MTKSKIQNLKSKINWLLIFILAVVLVLFLLFYRPAYYKPKPAADNRQLSPYLIYQLSPQFYNGAQNQEPFDLVVTQEEINDVVAHLPMPKESENIGMARPMIIFVPGTIRLVTSGLFYGARLIVTIEVVPAFDTSGLLNINLSKVKLGAVNVTPAARILARKICFDRLDLNKFNPDDIRTRLAASLFKDKPFDPVFTVEDKKIRLDKVTITDGKLILHFVPVPKTAGAVILKY